MNLADFYYDLPKNLIGQKAIEPRDSCRLMAINRRTKAITNHIFRDLLELLDTETVLVVNDTKVFPARLFGRKETGGKLEVLLLKQITNDSYRCLVKGKVKTGLKIVFSTNLYASVESVDMEGEVIIKFNDSGLNLVKKIDNLGKTPLPPYIKSLEKESNLRNQYQTVYAKEKGSAAAPTAGLHFTEKLISDLQKKGVEIEKITLHVGLGTFKPVTDNQVLTKTLHTETYFLSKDTAERLNAAKVNNKKIIAVGTTTCRVLETLSDANGIIHSGEGETNIFIQPGYKFKFIDGLITNFHLPSTSLLMLVSAFTEPLDVKQKLSCSLMGKAYEQAIKKGYKFFSFGDAMLIR